MLILSSTTDALQVITSSVADLDYVVSHVDKDNSTTPVITPDVTSGSIVTATTTTIGPTPASTHQIAIQSIELRNKHASTSNDVTVQHVKTGGTARQLIKVTLLAGEKLARDKNGVWFKYDATGGVKTAIAIPFTRTVLTAGVGATYTTPPGARAIDAELAAGGGAGGGASLVASSGGAGGGGGSGGYTKKLITSPAASYPFTIGAGGTPAAAGANAGGNGGDTTFGTSLLTAKGGQGGAGCTSAAATRALGGAGGIAGTGGDINAPGDPGRTGVVMTAALVASGAGGSNVNGGGAPGVIAQGAGTAAGANTGSGGSGGVSVSGGAAVAGGTGGSGVIVVTEYF